MNRFKLNKLNRLNKNVLLILFLVFSVLFVLGCNITYNGTNLLVTPTATVIATAPVKTIVVTSVNNSFDCYINVDSVNTRSCADSSCSTIKSWAIKNQKIHIENVSSDGLWGFWSAHGWVRLQYCTTVK